MHSHNRQSDRPTMKDSVNGLFYLACCVSQCFTVFLRRDFGAKAFGLPTIIAGGIILLYGSMMHCQEMWIYFWIWVLALVAQRIKQFQNWQNGVVLHSLYQGDSWLAHKLFPRIKSDSNAKGVEAFILLTVGGLLTTISPHLGWFVCLGFPAILFAEAVVVDVTRQRLQARRDAEIEQAYFEERYKSGKF
jgi:hypothetical protein